MADALERLTNLLAALLETKVPLTLDQLFHNLDGQYPAEIQARRGAFERDKLVLRNQGIPLQQKVLADGGTGYWIDRSAYELGDLGLTEDEKRALQLAVAAVRLGVDWGDDALLKLGASDDEQSVDVTAALPSLPALEPLFGAHLGRAVVTFGYRGKDRRLEPWGLLSREGFWYVVGFEHEAGEQRTFRVDRIDGAVAVGEPGQFSVPTDFNPATAVLDDPKSVGGDIDTHARVLVDAVRAARIVTEMGAAAVEERRDDGSVVVRVPCANRPAFVSWLLGLAEHAEVLSPAEVRAEVVERLERIAGAA